MKSGHFVLTALVLTLFAFSVFAGEKHRVRVQFTVTYDSLTLEQAAEIEKTVKDKLCDGKITMSVSDVPQHIRESLFWNSQGIDTSDIKPWRSLFIPDMDTVRFMSPMLIR